MSLLAQACVSFTIARIPVSTRVCGSNSWEWVPASEQNPLCSSFVFQKMESLWNSRSFGKSWGYTLIRPLPPRKRNRNLLCICLFICLFICLYIYHIFLFISICIQSFGPMLPCESLPQCSQCCLSDVAHPGHGMVLGQSLGNSIFWILYKLAKCLNHKPQTQRITIRTWPAQRSACMI